MTIETNKEIENKEYPNMNVKVVLDNPVEKEFDITINSSYIKEKYEEKLTETRQKARIPGFRIGKTPLSLIESRYSEGIYSEVSSEIINQKINDLIESRGIKILSQPSVTQKEHMLGKDIELSLKIESQPEIIQPDFNNITLDEPILNFSDTDIQEALEIFAKQHKTYKEKSTGIVEDNDQVSIDCKGRVEGQEFKEATLKDHVFSIGSKTMIPGFEEQIIGHKIGESFTIKVTFPESYHASHLASKEAEFDITINKINQSIVPNIDDDLAKKLDLQDLSELKDTISKKLSNEVNEQIFIVLKKDLFDQIDSLLTFDVPKSLYDQEYKSVSNNIKNDKQLKDKTEDEIKILCKKLANRRVRVGLMLGEFAKKNNIEITQEDIYNDFVNKAQHNPKNSEQLMKIYQNPQFLDSLKGMILENKVVKHIIDNIIKKNPITYTYSEIQEFFNNKNRQSYGY